MTLISHLNRFSRVAFLGPFVILCLLISEVFAHAQTNTYYLHKAAYSTGGLFVLTVARVESNAIKHLSAN